MNIRKALVLTIKALIISLILALAVAVLDYFSTERFKGHFLALLGSTWLVMALVVGVVVYRLDQIEKENAEMDRAYNERKKRREGGANANLSHDDPG